MNEINIAELRTWMHECGAIALRSFRNVVGHRKADQSWVTEADVEIERVLVERITARYPDHGILGEEQTRQGIDREFLWALDPIDGTALFVAGLPTWGISAGPAAPWRALLRHDLFPAAGGLLLGRPRRAALCSTISQSTCYRHARRIARIGLQPHRTRTAASQSISPAKRAVSARRSAPSAMSRAAARSAG